MPALREDFRTPMPVGRLRRIVLNGVLTVTAIAAILPSSAVANPAPIHIAGTGADGVYIRPQPNTSQAALGWMPEGASPDYHCFTYGQLIGNVNVWFNVSYNGVTGFYASFFDDSHYQSEAELTATYGVPKCGAETVADTPDVSPAPAPVQGPAKAPYDGDAAADWGTKHARDTPPASSACTWFVSQALWAGGLDRSSTWTSDGTNGRRHRPGSQTAWYAPSLVGYIRRTYPRSTFRQISFRVNAVPDARRGDVILYDWDGDATVDDYDGIDHAALVVNIARGQYPEVSEWSVSDIGPFGRPSSYTKRGWTWSQRAHTWLQKEHKNVRAFLLHIDAGA